MKCLSHTIKSMYKHKHYYNNSNYFILYKNMYLFELLKNIKLVV